jgi:D-sedoheptulose 7-phosphate isomerase
VEKIIKTILSESIEIKEKFINENISSIIMVSQKIAQSFTNDGKLMICGNGGSAADAQHIAGEFVNRLLIERPPLPAIALTTDTSVITSIGNDYSFNDIFSKQVKAIGLEGDVLLAISTSGNSDNLMEAVKVAKDRHIFAIGLLGGDGGKLAREADLSMIVKGRITPRIQETHILVGHMICQLVDYLLFQQGIKSTRSKSD